MPKIVGDTNSAKLIFKILELLAASSNSVGVTEISLALGATKTRVYRLLKVLVDIGYVVQSKKTDRYRIGSRLITLGHAVSKNIDLLSAAMEPLRSLRDKLGHTSVISQVEELGVRVVMTSTGTAPMKISVDHGWLLPFHSSAQGKVALAFSSSDLIQIVMSRKMEKLTSRTVTNTSLLERELTQIRKRGWATAPGQSVIGLNTLAFPIFNEHGHVIASIAIIDFEQFVTGTPEQIEAVGAASRQISHRLGYQKEAATER